MFSHDLFQALCSQPAKTKSVPPATPPQPEGDMVDAIQRAMDTYQRLNSDQSSSER